ncbi:MAG: ComEA family DNA-binding protein [Candidatus Omnitrophota bacterium]
MMELTKQEKYTILFLVVSAFAGLVILSVKHVYGRPRIEIVHGPSLEKEIAESKMININTATRDDLERLKGVGPALAAAIIAYRGEYGPFKRAEELRGVKGIGPVKYEAIRHRITTE